MERRIGGGKLTDGCNLTAIIPLSQVKGKDVFTLSYKALRLHLHYIHLVVTLELGKKKQHLINVIISILIN